ncbi:MAG: hypothetical protein AB1646_09870 [Thermodesulfobacteriota bacterium]
MKKAKEKLTALLNAVTFAEAGEHEAAMEFLEQVEQDPSGEATSKNTALEKVAARGRDLVRRVEEQMVPAAFAEAGEFATAHDLLTGNKRAHAVLLVIDGNSAEPEPVAYAMNLCTRISADMELLVLSRNGDASTAQYSPSETEALRERVAGTCQMARERGVSCNVVFEEGDLRQRMVDYIRRHKEIAALIIGSGGDRKNSRGAALLRALEDHANRLSIPLVRVMARSPVGKTT